ncbi:hypothetical protein BC943DRAFT_342034 [Umbelopsis sp. AD052]|nr:hypothetical protein BC943DRAFT_342034 [Umbelopsis sp. AD052]
MLVYKSKQDTQNDIERRESGVQDSELTPGNFDTTTIWNKIAGDYDKEIATDEFWMGIGLLRRWLIGKAKGDVLEVSAGTGRNFEHYKSDHVTSLTFTDKSPSMLEEAKSKFEQYSDNFKKAFVGFKRADVQEIGSLTTDDGKPMKFDTVIDTFGLCSCSDPVEAILGMVNACKDSEDARILLLEHGRSHYDWLNNLLDKNADKHVSKWGCWWNRDFMSVFEDERVTRELDIEKVSRWHLGTTYYVIAKKKSNSTT